MDQRRPRIQVLLHERHSVRVAYVTHDLTHLRYFIPFSRCLHRCASDIEQSFFLPRGNPKYNGLRSDTNYSACQRLIAQHCPYASETDGSGNFDIVIQVEVGAYLKCDRRISLEHGFDYAFRASELKEQVETYVCSSELTRDHASSLGVPAIISPLPVCMWDVGETQATPSTALLFYPDQGDADIANEVIEHLEKQGFLVFVKQRRKWQSISGGGTHLYDDVWYPSEAVVVPLASDLVIGFGSSAYVDLVPMGVTYVNIDIHHDRGPWSAFVHPIDKNYVRVTDRNLIFETLDRVTASTRSISRSIPDAELIDAFLIGLMHGH